MPLLILLATLYVSLLTKEPANKVLSLAKSSAILRLSKRFHASDLLLSADFLLLLTFRFSLWSLVGCGLWVFGHGYGFLLFRTFLIRAATFVRFFFCLEVSRARLAIAFFLRSLAVWLGKIVPPYSMLPYNGADRMHRYLNRSFYPVQMDLLKSIGGG